MLSIFLQHHISKASILFLSDFFIKCMQGAEKIAISTNLSLFLGNDAR